MAQFNLGFVYRAWGELAAKNIPDHWTGIAKRHHKAILMRKMIWV